jgi:hypothetical protein
MSLPPIPLRDGFWATRAPLPSGLALEREEPITVLRPGPGGASVFDVVDLVTPSGHIPLVACYQAPLLATHVAGIKERAVLVGQQWASRQLAQGRQVPEPLPAIITDVAKPSVIEACRRHGVAVLDQSGTVVVQAGSVFVFVEGKTTVERPWRGRLYSGKASRIVRFLLTTAAFEPSAHPRTAQAIATVCDLSYAYAHGVLTKLERDGFVDRRSAHGGFRVKNALGLLRSWVASGERAAIAVDGFYAPATSHAALAAAADKLSRDCGQTPLFSLASALLPSDVHVAGLPHGAYWTGELPRLVEALSLKRTTPHNFLVLSPDPLVWTAAGGLLLADSADTAANMDNPFRRVSLPQLAADFSTLPSRGREQAEFLLGVYAKRLPYHLDEP